MRSKRLVLAGMGLLLAPKAIFAQSEPVKEPVVVSASRRPEPLWETPAALGLIGEDQLEGAGPRVQAAEALQRLPGMVAADRGNYAQDPQLSVRGFGARAAFGVRGIRLISDGIPASIPDGQGQASSFALGSAERMEVLRGPMAVLYGNASGAVIQTFTRVPEPGLKLQAEAYAGSLGLSKQALQAEYRDGPSDAILDFSDFSIDGYRRHSAAARKQIQGVYRYQWGEATQLRVLAQLWDQPYAKDPAGLSLEQLRLDPRQAGTNTVERNVRKQTSQDQLGLAVDHRLSDAMDLNVYGYIGTRDNLQYLASNSWVGLDRSYQGLGLRFNHRMVLREIPIRWSLSLERENSEERRQSGSANLGEKVGGLTRDEDQRAQSEQAVWIAQADLSERWSAFGGLRHGTVRLSAQDYYLSDRQDGSGEVKFRQTSPVIGIQHWLGRNQQLYLSTARGYETPTLAELSYVIDPLSPSRILPRFNSQLDAARNRQWELGWRGRSAGLHRWELTGFSVRSSNEIVVDRSLAGQNSFRNAPGTERYGVELAWQSQWQANWQSYVSLTSMKALYRGDWTVSGLAMDGRSMPAIPELSAFAELRYQQAQQVVAAELRHVGKRFANDINSLSASAFQTLALRWQQQFVVGSYQLTVSARLDNLFDRRYVGSLIVNNASPFEPSPGRTAWVALRAAIPRL
ncbi:MAG: TonB-dependent receptor [Betaproteobacteria bacterium]|nr:TonB-dependent receptor [Betaproteobacteria bacterium]